MAWFKQGGFAQPEMDQRRQKKNLASNLRLWVPPENKEKGITGRERGMFADTKPLCIYEHNPYLDGTWRNQHSCPGQDSPDGCPLCDIGNEPEYVGFLTWFSFTPWGPDSKGREHTISKKLFPMKQKVWKIMTAAAEKRNNDLTGWVVECYRSSREEPSTGLSYDFEERIPQSEWRAKYGSRIITYGDQTVDSYLQPFDYEQLLAPKSTAELKRLANRLKYKGAPNGDDDDDKTPEDDSDIPF
jgi:hypothetical protein